MSIVVLKKITVCSLLSEKDRLLDQLQSLGCLHLEALREGAGHAEPVTPERAEAVTAALRHLRDAPVKRRPVREGDHFEVETVVAQVLANKQAIRDVGDQRDFVRQRIRDLEPWGDFQLPPKEDLAGNLLWFYVVPTKDMPAVEASGLTWQIVHEDPRVNYLVVISPTEPPSESMPVRRTYTGARPLSTLADDLELLEIELERLAAEREALTRWIQLLHSNYQRAEDLASRRQAAGLTLDSHDGIVTLQGWAPAIRLSELEQFAERNGMAMLAEDPGPEDTPPTLMDNPDAMKSGEMLVSFYQTPAYQEWDPSRLVLISFALFFAMILADAGYALVLMAGLLLFWRKLGASPKGASLRDMLALLFGFSIAFGVLVGSYFGVAPPEGSPLAHFHVLNLQDYDTMMSLSITIGGLHVILANAMAARHAADRPRRINHLSWIAVVAGGLAMWLGRGPGDELTTSQLAGGALIIGGLLALLLFASSREVHGPRDAAMRLLDGLKNLTNLTQAFGDVLSYMRLFALGLASASMAMTFNQLAMSALHSVPGLGLLFALLILLFGHAINLALCIMSGVVHGLRLNVIEFFKWGLSAEGRPFNAYAKKEAE